MRQICGLLELSLDRPDQFLALLVNGILAFKEGAAFVVALGFDVLDLLLAGELVFQRLEDNETVSVDEAKRSRSVTRCAA